MPTEKKPMQEHLGFRVPADVLTRLDKLAVAMSVRFSALGFNLSRADAARAAMMSGLPIVEQEYGVAPRAEGSDEAPPTRPAISKRGRKLPR